MTSTEKLNIKSVIFDLDGLLLNSEAQWLAAKCIVLEKNGVSNPYCQREKLSGVSFRDLREKFQIKTEYLTLREEFWNEFRQCCQSQPLDLMPGAMETLDRLSQNFQLAIASSNNTKFIREIVDRFGIINRFSYLVGGDQVERHKPFPDVYLKTASLLSSYPDQCVALEDSAVGVKSAKAAGIYCIGVLNTPEAKTTLVEADLILPGLNSISQDVINNLKQI